MVIVLISAKAIEYLEKRYNVSAFEMDFELIFGDISDNRLKTALREQPKTIWGVIENLAKAEEDPEIKAHILGWESAAARQADIDAFHAMQRKMADAVRQRKD